MASTEAETKLDVKGLKAELDKLGVEYAPKAKKAELEQLLATAQAKAAEKSDAEEPEAAEPVGDETPPQTSTDSAPMGDEETSASEDAEAAEEATPAKEPVPDGMLLKGLMHSGIEYLPGAPIPSGLTDGDLERLRRLGVIS